MIIKYNANGLRKNKKTANTATDFGWSGDKMIAEIKGRTTNIYGYGIDGIAVGTINGSTETYIKNAHGDVIGIYGESITKRKYWYEGFGSAVSTINASANPF